MKILAIIPARSGSKGLTDKNIRALKGKPLMAYTIEAAEESEIFEEIHVSTDSEKYAGIARMYGASVPFLRAPEYATDNAGSWDMVRYVIDKYRELGRSFDAVMLLQPTSPLRNATDIKNALREYVERDANAIVGVCEMEHSPLRSDILPDDMDMKMFTKGEYQRSIPRQMLPTFYRVNGSLYLVSCEWVMKSEDIYDEKCYAMIMPRDRSIDIDDELDFRIAEALIMN